MYAALNKSNAAGLAPEHSMALPERDALADEAPLLAALGGNAAGSAAWAPLLAPEAMLTTRDGAVAVGHAAVLARLSALSTAAAPMRLLETPAALPPRTMVVDVAEADGTHTLIVLKRRAHDGLVSSIVEEAGHRRASVPLAARAGNHMLNSPTDMMISPCTSKLNLAKRRHYMKAKPTKLFAGAHGQAL